MVPPPLLIVIGLFVSWVSTVIAWYIQNFVSDRLTIPLGSGRLLLPHFTISSGRLWDIVPKASHLSKRLQVSVLRERYFPFCGSWAFQVSSLFLSLFHCRGHFPAGYFSQDTSTRPMISTDSSRAQCAERIFLQTCRVGKSIYCCLGVDMVSSPAALLVRSRASYCLSGRLGAR